MRANSKAEQGGHSSSPSMSVQARQARRAREPSRGRCDRLTMAVRRFRRGNQGGARWIFGVPLVAAVAADAASAFPCCSSEIGRTAFGEIEFSDERPVFGLAAVEWTVANPPGVVEEHPTHPGRQRAGWTIRKADADANNGALTCSRLQCGMAASADTMFDVLDSAFGSVGELYFRRFMRSCLTGKWMIGADFVIGAPEAVHDVFAFTIFPHYDEFTATVAGIAKIFPRDLKRTKVLTNEMVMFLRDTKRFHFCFLVEKDRYISGSIEMARVAIAHALQLVRGFDTGGLASAEERRHLYIENLRVVEETAKAKRFHFRNFFDIHILSVLLATIMLWIVRHGECTGVGLFPAGLFNAG
jgi:hypothetical protein